VNLRTLIATDAWAVHVAQRTAADNRDRKLREAVERIVAAYDVARKANPGVRPGPQVFEALREALK
jgi:hypothetical protein